MDPTTIWVAAITAASTLAASVVGAAIVALSSYLRTERERHLLAAREALRSLDELRDSVRSHRLRDRDPDLGFVIENQRLVTAARSVNLVPRHRDVAHLSNFIDDVIDEGWHVTVADHIEERPAMVGLRDDDPDEDRAIGQRLCDVDVHVVCGHVAKVTGSPALSAAAPTFGIETSRAPSAIANAAT